MNTPVETHPGTDLDTKVIDRWEVFWWWLGLIVFSGVFLLLSLLVTAEFLPYQDHSHENIAARSVQIFEKTIIRYKTTMNVTPKSLRDLAIRPADAKGPWCKMVEESELIDPWCQPYQFRNPGKHNPNGYDIFSKGPDMKEDTPDDVGNWQN